MTVVKVVELMGESTTSWEDAVNQAVKAASQTIRNISGVEVMNMTASVDNAKITKYKADVHVAFTVDGT